MGVSTSFEELSQFIERYESDGGKIHRVEVMTPTQESETKLSVTLDLPVSICQNTESGVEELLRTATISDNGGLEVEFSSAIFPELDEYIPENTSITRGDVRVTDDGTILSTFTLMLGEELDEEQSELSRSHSCSSSAAGNQSIEHTDMGDNESETDEKRAIDEYGTAVAIEDTTSNQDKIKSELNTVRNKNLPPYEDTQYLQCLYDNFSTFTAMSEEFEIDVASETVRRYMIDAEIHEPASYQTSDEERSEDHIEELDDTANGPEQPTSDKSAKDTPSSTESYSEKNQIEEDPIENVSNKQLLADGFGLPDNLTLEKLADAIESSMTLYDMQRQLNIDRKRTRELLEQLNLIDLVMRRMAHNPDKAVSREEIADRIRNSTQSGC